MKSKISKMLLGLIITIAILFSTFGSALANPKTYVFSGYVVGKYYDVGWASWEALGYPSVSVGDWFVGTFSYSFDEQPNIVSEGVYDISNFRVTTTIHFDEFFVQNNHTTRGYINSDRTRVSFTYGPYSDGWEGSCSGYDFTNLELDDMDLSFNFSKSLGGTGFPEALDTCALDSAGLSLDWLVGWDEANLNCKIVIFKSVPAEGPSPCILDSRFEETTLADGIEYYTDRDYTLTNVPSQYVGMNTIKTPNDERNRTDEKDYMTFEMTDDGMVYVAFDSRATSLPSWMSGFNDTGDRIYTSLGSQPFLKVYGRSYSANDCVNFGANKASGFAGGTVSNYIAFYGSGPPPPTCNLDSRFEETNLNIGIEYYTDRDYTITDVVEGFFGKEWIGAYMIKPPNDERNRSDEKDYITFELPYYSRVCVAFDGRAKSLPYWMDGFEDTGARIYTSLSTQPYLKIYMKYYKNAGCVNLGANKAPGFSGGTVSNYIVFVLSGS